MDKLKILVVEDSNTIRKLTVAQLKHIFKGVLIDEAEDGEIALGFVQDNNYNIVICDNSMPNMDGFEFINIAKYKLKNTLTIMCSGSVEFKEEALKCGFKMFISKPFNPKLDIFYDTVVKQFPENIPTPETKFQKWVHESHEMCNELNPSARESFLKEVEQCSFDIIKLLTSHDDKQLSKTFHSIKGILSYFNDDMMDEAYHFEKAAKESRLLGNEEIERLTEFLNALNELISYDG